MMEDREKIKEWPSLILGYINVSLHKFLWLIDSLTYSCNPLFYGLNEKKYTNSGFVEFNDRFSSGDIIPVCLTSISYNWYAFTLQL